MTHYPFEHRIQRPSAYVPHVATDITRTFAAARRDIAASGGQRVVERSRLVHTKRRVVITENHENGALA